MTNSQSSPRRVLVVDDNPAIHEDFKKILCPATRASDALKAAAADLFGNDAAEQSEALTYEIGSALSGQAGVSKVKEALENNQPYLLAFIDMNMPNGWNGIETIQRVWDLQPTLQIVICTAFSDFSWEQIHEGLAHRDRYLILKKPFDNIEVQQLALALTGRALSELSLARSDEIRKQTEKEIQKLAFSDPLTGLPNRRQLIARLDTTIQRCQEHPEYCALFFIEIDHFKDINDAFGHSYGDLIVIEMAKRLSEMSSKTCDVARLGGDEFVVLTEGLGTDLDAATVKASNIILEIKDELRKPYFINEIENHITLSVGISIFGMTPVSVETLMQHADLAMYQAKTDGRSTYRFFDQEMESAAHERSLIASELRLAIDRHQLTLHYHPQIDHERGVVGAEALLRWQRPGKQQISPAIFIPIAERTGQMSRLGDWVLEQAFLELARWASLPHMENLMMSVNVSPQQFQAADFNEKVLSALTRTGAPAKRLKIEITESMLMHDLPNIKRKMLELKSYDIHFSIDDFGTGYSSLSYLKQLSLDQLKIDQSFVKDLTTGSSSAHIAGAISTLGRSLELEIIAEGVETSAHRDFLIEIGCTNFQGYFFSQPLSSREFEAYVLRYQKPE